MGMKKDIAELGERLYTSGIDGRKIATRFIQAGLRMMLEEGEIAANKVSVIPIDEDGAFKLIHHINNVQMLNEYMPKDRQLGKNDAIIIRTNDRGSFSIEWANDRHKIAIVPIDYPTEPTSMKLLSRALGEMTIKGGDVFNIMIDDDRKGFSVQALTDRAIREAVEHAFVVPGSEPPIVSPINAVAAMQAMLRDLMDDEDFSVPNDRIGHIFEGLDQMLDRMFVITDADVPAYIRTLAGVADGTLKGGSNETETHSARVLYALADQLEKGLHVGLEDEAKALREITERIGQANVTAGWWTEQNTDLRRCPYTLHVVAGKLMLVTSEVSEGMEGWRKSQKTILMDDHLPHRPMLEVELADAHIRLFDLGANVEFPDGRKLDVPGAIIEKLAYNAIRPDHKKENREAEGGKAS